MGAMKCSKGCDRSATRRGMCNTCYMSYRNKQVAYGRWQTLMVDAEPVRKHIVELKARDIGSRRIEELTGISRSAIQSVLRGRPSQNRPPRRRVLRTTAEKILAIPLDVDHRCRGTRRDATGSVRRLRALQAIGWTQTEIARRLGWTCANINRYFLGRQDTISHGFAKDIAALFDELQLSPGPSDRARQQARLRGWAPPLAWDEDTIDDPAAKPDVGVHRPVGFAERYTEERELGYNDLQILARWRVRPESLVRQLHRYDMPVAPELMTLATSCKYQRGKAAS